MVELKNLIYFLTENLVYKIHRNDSNYLARPSKNTRKNFSESQNSQIFKIKINLKKKKILNQIK